MFLRMGCSVNKLDSNKLPKFVCRLTIRVENKIDLDNMWHNEIGKSCILIVLTLKNV